MSERVLPSKAGEMSCSNKRLYSRKVRGLVVFSLILSQDFAKSLKQTV